MRAEKLLLKNACVVGLRRDIDEADVLIKDSHIARISARGTPEEASNSISLDGLTLYPGFIDGHIHGAVGVDALEATAGDLQRVAAFLATRGVTAWLPTLVPAPAEDYARAVSAIETLMREQSNDNDETPVGAHALGVHYEGPFVNAAQCGALRTEYFQTFADASSLAEIVALPENCPALGDARAAHMITVAPEIEGGVLLVSELSKRGWIVSIGHTRADVSTLDAALVAGARHMTHFFNAMSPLHHRAPGVVGWGLTQDAVTCDVIADGVHCAPVMLDVALRCKTAERLILISDAVLPAGLGDGEYRVWGETIRVEHGRTRNARGAIAGSVSTMLDAVRTMHSLGCAPHEIARMASFNPARLLGVDRLTGSIETGKRADLVALDDEGQVRLTLVGGRIAYEALG